MPYPKACPLCAVPYPDERSHYSLGSRHLAGHTFIKLVCKHCGGSYHWHFQGARVVPVEVQPVGPSTVQVADANSVGYLERYLQEFQAEQQNRLADR